VRGVCGKPKVKCGQCPKQAFFPVDDRVIADHLSGKYTAGVYVDRNVPVFDRMFRRRLAGYRSIGYVEAELPPGYGEADDDWTLGRGWDDSLDEEDAGEASTSDG
jgi:hypothetical protein